MHVLTWLCAGVALGPSTDDSIKLDFNEVSTGPVIMPPPLRIKTGRGRGAEGPLRLVNCSGQRRSMGE
jgi:hypothetical protein